MTLSTQRFIVLTGGPGAGKSTVIEALRRRGIATAPEAGRAIIREEVASGGQALPWGHPSLFAERMLAFDRASYRAALAHGGATIFDRGIPDIIGYCRLSGIIVSADLEQAARILRYAREVFVAPPWETIYRQDAERTQDFAEAVETCKAVSAAYRELGHDLVDLPRADVEDRADFIVARAGLTARRG